MKFHKPKEEEKEERRKGKRRWRWSVIVAFLVSILTIWLSFRGIELSQLKEALRGVNYFWIWLAVGNSLFNVYALGWRWRLLLKPRIDLPLKSLFRLNILSQYANILAPARLGELWRMYLASKEAKAESGFILGTIAAERILDALVFISSWLFLSSYFTLPESISFPLSLLAGLVVMTGLVVLFTFTPNFFLKSLGQALFFLPENWKRRFLDFIKNGVEAFTYFKKAEGTALVLLLTLFLLLIQALTNYLVILAFGLKLSFLVAVIIILALQVGSLPPSAPGKIGVFEYAIVLTLSFFAVPREKALGYAIMLHLVAYLPKIVLGGLYLASLPISFRLRNRKKENL